jgi:DNA-binding transcriptional LysR family regulator
MAYLDNIAVFVRVVELGNLSAAGRDMRISPAVASNRIKELEKHLGVRLFNRTTRQLMPTEHGNVFYSGAKQVLEAITEAEAAVSRFPASRAAPSASPRRSASAVGLSPRAFPSSTTSIPTSRSGSGFRTTMSISSRKVSTLPSGSA